MEHIITLSINLVAQLLIVPVVHAEFDPVDDLDETERGGGGFGSTGVK